MSRTSQLPPRFPHHSRVVVASPHNVPYLDLDLDLAAQQRGDVSDVPPPPPPSDAQCQWVDDLVRGWGDGSKPILAPLRRCVSDPVPILEESFNFDFSSLATDDDYDDEILKALGTDGGELHKSSLDNTKVEGQSVFACGGSNPRPSLVVPNPQQISEEEKVCCSSPAEKEEVRSGSVYGLNSPRRMERRSGSFYGPNSPRHMEDLTKSESSMVSAILENANSRNPFSYVVALNHPVGSGGANESGVKADASVAAASESRDSDKALRRHAGQRSRIRKVQYIAELERTVNFYQALVADLAARVGMLYQQRAVLSIENNTLRQEIANLKRNKMIKEGFLRILRSNMDLLSAKIDIWLKLDMLSYIMPMFLCTIGIWHSTQLPKLYILPTQHGQHHFLKNELKKLKATSGCHRKSKSSCFVMDAFRPGASDAYWGVLDVGTSLGKSPTPLRQGFRSP